MLQARAQRWMSKSVNGVHRGQKSLFPKIIADHLRDTNGGKLGHFEPILSHFGLSSHIKVTMFTLLAGVLEPRAWSKALEWCAHLKERVDNCDATVSA